MVQSPPADPSHVDRRTLLATTGIAVAVTLAGCSRSDNTVSVEEVDIESPDRVTNFSTLSDDQREQFRAARRERIYYSSSGYPPLADVEGYIRYNGSLYEVHITA